MTYRLTLARYSKTKCELRHMSEFSQASSFHAAVQDAESILKGCRSLDRDSEYSIAGIEIQGARPIKTEHGWETLEEMTARIGTQSNA